MATLQISADDVAARSNTDEDAGVLLAPGSVMELTYWWDEGRLVAEQTAAWVINPAKPEWGPVGIVEATVYVPLTNPELTAFDAADTLGWDQFVGDLAKAWETNPLPARSPSAGPGDTFRLPSRYAGVPPLPPTPAGGAAMRLGSPGFRPEMTVAVTAAPAFQLLGQALRGAVLLAAVQLGTEHAILSAPEADPVEQVDAEAGEIYESETLPALPLEEAPSDPDCDEAERAAIREYVKNLPEENHHMATYFWKRGDWLNRWLEITAALGTTAAEFETSRFNIIDIHHEAENGHPPEYHEWIERQMKRITNLAGGDKARFWALWRRQIGDYLKQHPEVAHEDWWDC